MAYPNGTDVGNFLIDAGVITALPGDLTRYNDFATAAAEHFERDTMLSPFEASASDTARKFRRFRARRGQTLLVVPLLSLTSVLADGVALTEGYDGDFLLMPKDGRPTTDPVNGRYYSWLEFIKEALWNELVITGKWGVVSNGALPASVKNAIIMKAAADISRFEIAGGDVISERQADVEFRYGEGRTQADNWLKAYESEVKRWKRREIY